MSADTDRVKALFRCALHLPPAERAAFLDLACRGQPALRSRVDELFAASDRAGDFLDDNSPPHPPADHSHPATDIGPYALDRLLGEGGMGVVWAAKQRHPIRRTVAVKLVRAGMDTAAVLARFEQERQVLARMDHPHIARVLDAGQTETGRPYFVMELVAGEPITRYCAARDLPLSGRLELFARVCMAVQHAHHKGVIHRDLKPSNILVAEVDGRPVPKVIDFGIAKAVGDEWASPSPTAAGWGVLGTLEYMAPEQADLGQPDVDTRADVYSLGAVLYELLVGLPPLAANEVRATPLVEALRRVREDVPPRPSARTVAADNRPTPAPRRELDWVVMKALEKDRERRYSTAADLAADVGRYLGHEPVAARPPSRGYRLAKFVRRNQLAVTAATLIALAVVGGAVAATAGLVTARKAEHDAREAQADAVAQRRVAEGQAAAAKESAAVSHSVLDHVRRNVFSAGRPAGVLGGRGRNITLRQALDAAVPSIATDFAGRPVVEAVVRHWAGQSYLALGEGEKAAEQLRLAVRLFDAHAPLGSSDRYAAPVDLAQAYLQTGNVADAITLLTRTVPAAEAHLGRDHPVTLAAKGTLGMAHDLDGHPEQAIGILEPLVADFTRVRGRTHSDTRHAASVLLLAYSRAGRTADVERMIERGDADPDDLNTRCVMTSVHLRAGRPGRAAEILRRVLPECEQTFGPEHPSTLDVIAALGGAEVADGRAEEGVDRLEAVVATMQTALRRNHPVTLQTSVDLAVGYDRLGRSTQAVELLEQVLPQYRDGVGIAHPDALTAAVALATAYTRLGRSREAVELLTKNIPPAANAVGSNHPNVLDAQLALAEAYLRSDRVSDAAELLKEVEAACRDTLPADHPITVRVLVKQARACKRQGQPAAAVRLLQKAVTARTAALGADHHDTLTATVELAAAHTQAGQPGEAICLLEKTVPALTAAVGSKNPDVLNATSELAIAYTRAGRKKEGADLLEKVYPVYVSVLGRKNPDTLTAALNVAEGYKQTNRHDRAADLLVEVLPLIREVYGDRHQQTLITTAVLAGVYTMIGRAADAIPLLEQVVAVRQAELGPDDKSTVMAASNLALALDAAGRAGAVKALEEVLPKCVAQFGEEDLQTLTIKCVLATALTRAGRPKDAAAVRDELLPVVRAKCGRGHPRVLQLVLDRANDQAATGEREKAIATVAEYLKDAGAALAKKPRELATARAAAGRLLLAAGEHEAAEAVLRDCLAAAKEAEATHWTVASAEALLGIALLERGKHTDAEPLLLSGRRGLAGRSGLPPGPWPGPAEVARRLADLYTALDKPDEAKAWRATAAEPEREILPPPRAASR